MNAIRSAFADAASRHLALRLTIASVLAMASATLLGLPNPWWAAMAVWMTGQPSRGVLLERSVAQLAGTLVGAIAAVLILKASAGQPAFATILLSVWVALCCGAANVLRHQRAYGLGLCGLTCGVIVILALRSPVDILAFASARVVDNLIGIAACVVVVAFFGPARPGHLLWERTRLLMARATRLLAATVSGDADTKLTGQEKALLKDLALHEASIEDLAAGSVSARAQLKFVNRLVAATLELVAHARALRTHADRPGPAAAVAVASALEHIADEIEQGRAFDVSALRSAVSGATGLLGESLRTLSHMADTEARMPASVGEPRVPLMQAHPDWRGVRLAVWRGLGLTLLVGQLWAGLDWEPLRYLCLGAVIFTSLFSTADEPAHMVRRVLVGGAVGAAAALAWRLLVVPEMSNASVSLLLAVPLIFGASLLQAARGTMFTGLAFNMLFAVLGQPVHLLATDGASMAMSELMLLSGIMLSEAAYRWLVPMNVARRREHLQLSMRREIDSIATRSGTVHAERHLARLRHLVMSVIARSEAGSADAEGAMEALGRGHALLRGAE